MMGRLASDRDKFFYEFRLHDHVPSDHLLRRIESRFESLVTRLEA